MDPSKSWIEKLPWESVGPLIFLAAAYAIIQLLPPAERRDAVYLVVGAALTRVKIAK